MKTPMEKIHEIGGVPGQGDWNKYWVEAWVCDEGEKLNEEIVIGSLTFRLTGNACPEQYDVLAEDGTEVGYVRLRHGNLRADVPECGGREIYSRQLDEEINAGGQFRDEKQRMEHLGNIAVIIERDMDKILYAIEAMTGAKEDALNLEGHLEDAEDRIAELEDRLDLPDDERWFGRKMDD